MATRTEKAQQVERLAEKLSSARSVVFVDFRGLTVAESNVLRARMRDAGVEFRVVKNTLAARAAASLDLTGVDGVFEGPTAIAFSDQDPVAPPREVVRFAKEARKLQLKGGLLESRVMDVDEVRRIADLPERDELLARVIGGASSPLSGFASAAQALLRNLTYAVDAVRRQREAA